MNTYTISWIDATLKRDQDWKEIQAEYAKGGIKTTLDGEDDDWYDFTAEHTFTAESDDEAIKYIKSYDFNMRNIDVFTCTGINGFRYTEQS